MADGGLVGASARQKRLTPGRYCLVPFYDLLCISDSRSSSSDISGTAAIAGL